MTRIITLVAGTPNALDPAEPSDLEAPGEVEDVAESVRSSYPVLKARGQSFTDAQHHGGAFSYEVPDYKVLDDKPPVYALHSIPAAEGGVPKIIEGLFGEHPTVFSCLVYLGKLKEVEEEVFDTLEITRQLPDQPGIDERLIEAREGNIAQSQRR